MPFSVSAILVVLAFAFGALLTWFIAARLRRWGARREDRIAIQSVIERVRALGKLVGLEVCAKEIATATSGWPWLPPLLLSQARLAMIFNFEKQYSVDLSGVGPQHVQELGHARFRITLPPIRGAMRLIDVTPYDIQGAKVLGLVDLVAMNAERQKELMRKAQQQAAELYESSDGRYREQARASIESHLRSLMALVGVDVEIAWREPGSERVSAPAEPAAAPQPRVLVAG